MDLNQLINSKISINTEGIIPVHMAGHPCRMDEIKTICKSGKKATMNARLDENGNRVTEGDQISIGLNYEAQARDVFELDKVSPIGYQIPEAN